MTTLFARLGLEEIKEDLTGDAPARKSVPPVELNTEDTNNSINDAGLDDDLATAVGQIEQEEKNTENTTHDIDTLENVSAAMEQALVRDGGLNDQGALFASLCVNNITQRQGLRKAPVPAMEDFGQGRRHYMTQISMEGVGETVKKLWDAFIAKMKALWDFILSFFSKAEKHAEQTEEKAKASQEEAKKEAAAPKAAERVMVEKEAAAPKAAERVMVEVDATWLTFGNKQINPQELPEYMQKSTECLVFHIAHSEELVNHVLNVLHTPHEPKDEVAINKQVTDLIVAYIEKLCHGGSVRKFNTVEGRENIVLGMPPHLGIGGFEIGYSGHANVKNGRAIFNANVITESPPPSSKTVKIEAMSPGTRIAVGATAQRISRAVKQYGEKMEARTKHFDKVLDDLRKRSLKMGDRVDLTTTEEHTVFMMRSEATVIANFARAINKIDVILTKYALAMCDHTLELGKKQGVVE